MSTTPPEPYRDPTPPPAYAPPPDQTARGGDRRAKGPAGLGVVAFVASLLGGVGGGLLSLFAGLQLGGLARWAELSADGTSVSLDYDSLPAEAQQIAVLGAVLTFAAFAVWGVLALWGFIQGIVAVVKNRGRAWGVVAIILAVIGIFAVLALYALGFAMGAAPYLA